MTTLPPYELMRVLQFDREDLLCNREGRLSARQAEKLRSQQQVSNRGFWIYLLVVFGAIGVSMAREPISLSPMVLMSWGAAGVIGIVIIAFIIIPWMNRYNNEWKQGRVSSAEGTGKLGKSYVRGGTVYFIRIGRQSFYIAREGYEYLKRYQEPHNPVYRVYYTPFIKQVVSIDIVGGTR
jgi:vacuolar-type H+-ATPase subunit I/STV1